MKFTESIRSGFKNYARFSGRASRSEYWYWLLFTYLANLVFSLLVILPLFIVLKPSHSPDVISFFSHFKPLIISYVIFYLFLLPPSLSVAARRLHDTDRSAWWLLYYLLCTTSSFLFGIALLAPQYRSLMLPIYYSLNPFNIVLSAFFWVFIFSKGTTGDNRFGLDPVPDAPPSISFSEAVRAGFRNYCKFSGKASRSEFWMWILFGVLLSMSISFIENFIEAATLYMGHILPPNTVVGALDMSGFPQPYQHPNMSFTLFASAILMIVLFIPNLTITVRRLHDVGKSGWWLLTYYLLLIAASIVVTILKPPPILAFIFIISSLIYLFYLPFVLCQKGIHDNRKPSQTTHFNL